MSGDRILKISLVLGLAAFVMLAFSVGSLTAHAQLAGATLSGQVMDQSGGVVVEAKLVIKNNATGEVRTVTTNAKGLYSAQSLQPGIYSVAVSAPGFVTRVQQTVELTVGATRELDLSLSPGQISERVEVSADVADVETDTSVNRGTETHSRPAPEWQRLDSARDFAARRRQRASPATYNGKFESRSPRLRQSIGQQWA